MIEKIDILKKSNRPYYIATGEYIQQSNGFRVPFYLCHILNELGFEAYVTAQKQAPNLRTPLLTPEIIQKHKEDRREIIAVYTEAMWGNVLCGDVVVRWILNRIGKLFDERDFPNDLFFYWDAAYAKDVNAAITLQAPCINEDVFFIDTTQQDRNGFAYYAHKYLRDYDGFIPDEIKKNGISLCQDIIRTHEEIADILRSVKVLYCFEDSAIALEAAVCGCIVVLVETEFTLFLKDKAKYVDYIVPLEELDINEEFPYLHKAHVNYLKDKEKIETDIRDFIIATQQAAINKNKEADSLLSFVRKYECICIYGNGLTADVVYNALSAIGANIYGFVVSDDYYSDDTNKHGLPIISFSELLKINNSSIGVVTAMIKQYYNQVIPILKRHSINIYNPVLF